MPKPCLFGSESVCLGKYFSPPNLQNGIWVAMDLRRGPSRVNINKQSCRPPMFGLESHSGISGPKLQEPRRLTAKLRYTPAPLPWMSPRDPGQVSVKLSEGEARQRQFRSIAALFAELPELCGSEVHQPVSSWCWVQSLLPDCSKSYLIYYMSSNQGFIHHFGLHQMFYYFDSCKIVHP